MSLKICLILLAPSILQGDFAMKISPSVPRKVNAKALNSSSVRVRWSPPLKPYGHIIGYIVSCYLDKGQRNDIHLPPVLTYVVTGLKPRQTISVAVRALTQRGLIFKHRYANDFSRTVNVTTLPLERGVGRDRREKPPPPPRSPSSQTSAGKINGRSTRPPASGMTRGSVLRRP
ncbi:Oncosphere antigen A [Taenia solium]|eukprot:TsM_000321800 transcript=TsM_000321800 gene=TsM_000321800